MTLYRNLLSNTIFVFASNLAGKHVDAASAFAAEHFNASPGVGEGPTGSSYAVPMQDENLDNLQLADIQWHIEQLLAHGRTQRDSRFQVVRLGCGANGFTDAQIAPLFKKTSDNLFIPGRWMALNRQLGCARLFVDGDMLFSAERIEKTLNECTAPWGDNIEVITTGVGLVNDIVRAWARRKDFPWTPFLTDSAKFGDMAEAVLDAQLAWYCTHAIVYHNQTSGSFCRRMDVLRKELIKVRHIQG